MEHEHSWDTPKYLWDTPCDVSIIFYYFFSAGHGTACGTLVLETPRDNGKILKFNKVFLGLKLYYWFCFVVGYWIDTFPMSCLFDGSSIYYVGLVLVSFCFGCLRIQQHSNRITNKNI